MGSPLGSEEAGVVLGPDQYVCTLPAEVCKLAETHLKEEEQARTSGIVQMRNFISSHPLITKCRLGKTWWCGLNDCGALSLSLSLVFLFFL